MIGKIARNCRSNDTFPKLNTICQSVGFYSISTVMPLRDIIVKENLCDINDASIHIKQSNLYLFSHVIHTSHICLSFFIIISIIYSYVFFLFFYCFFVFFLFSPFLKFHFKHFPRMFPKDFKIHIATRKWLKDKIIIPTMSHKYSQNANNLRLRNCRLLAQLHWTGDFRFEINTANCLPKRHSAAFRCNLFTALTNDNNDDILR